MNKKFLILPIVSALLLAGCTLGGKKSNKKKKSSSAVITSVTSGGNTSQGGTSQGGTSQGGTSQGGTSQGGTSQGGTSQGGTSVAPTKEWSAAELADFTNYFGGVVPPYFEIDTEYSEPENGSLMSVDMTDTEAAAYISSLDSSWTEVTTTQGSYYQKDASNGTGYVMLYTGSYEGGSYIVAQWYSPLASISLSGTYQTTFDVGDTFNHDGLVVSGTCKDGYVYADITSEATFSTPDMSTPGQKTVTVSVEDDEVISTSYTITVNSSVKYTVSFDAGEGSGTKAPVEASEGSYLLPDSTGFTAPDGKAFAGWKANNTGDLIPVGGSYNLTAAVTFYAQWAAEYTVSFSAGEGSGTMAPVKVGEGGSIVEPTCTFTAPTGKEFDKWVIGTQPVVFPYTVTGNVTLTATWKDKATPVQSVKYTIDNPADQYGKKFSDLTADQVLSGFVSDGDAVITGFKDNNGNVYFGGNGGSGTSAFTFVDAFKLGKSKAKGEITLTIGSSYSFSKIAFTLCGQRDDGSITVNGVEKPVTAKITGSGALTPSTVTTQTVEFDIASGTTDFVLSSKDSADYNYSIYIVGIEFIA